MAGEQAHGAGYAVNFEIVVFIVFLHTIRNYTTIPLFGEIRVPVCRHIFASVVLAMTSLDIPRISTFITENPRDE
jgi:hypothetical protein